MMRFLQATDLGTVLMDTASTVASTAVSMLVLGVCLCCVTDPIGS